jgi:hypothetical protein
MDKKVLKWYEAPEVEIVELEVEGQILAGSEGAELDPVEFEDE